MGSARFPLTISSDEFDVFTGETESIRVEYITITFTDRLFIAISNEGRLGSLIDNRVHFAPDNDDTEIETDVVLGRGDDAHARAFANQLGKLAFQTTGLPSVVSLNLPREVLENGKAIHNMSHHLFPSAADKSSKARSVGLNPPDRIEEHVPRE